MEVDLKRWSPPRGRPPAPPETGRPGDNPEESISMEGDPPEGGPNIALAASRAEVKVAIRTHLALEDHVNRLQSQNNELQQQVNQLQFVSMEHDKRVYKIFTRL